MGWMRFAKIFVLALIFGQVNPCLATTRDNEARKQMDRALGTDNGPRYTWPTGNLRPQPSGPVARPTTVLSSSRLAPQVSSGAVNYGSSSRPKTRVGGNPSNGQQPSTVGDVRSLMLSKRSGAVPPPLPPVPSAFAATVPSFRGGDTVASVNPALTRSVSTPEPSFVVSPSPTAIIERPSAPSTDLLQPPSDQTVQSRPMSTARRLQRNMVLQQASSQQATPAPLTTESLRQLDELMGSAVPKDKSSESDWQSLPGVVPELNARAEALAAMHSVVPPEETVVLETRYSSSAYKGDPGKLRDLNNSTAVVEALRKKLDDLDPIDPLRDDQLTKLFKKDAFDKLIKQIDRATLTEAFRRAEYAGDTQGMLRHSEELKTFDGENPKVTSTPGFSFFYDREQ